MTYAVECGSVESRQQLWNYSTVGDLLMHAPFTYDSSPAATR